MPDSSKIHIRVIIKILGAFLIILGVMMASSAIFSFLYKENDGPAILLSSGITILSGMLLFFANRNVDLKSIGKKDGFIIVTFTWIVISLFGTLPFLISGQITNFTDAFFETMSGFTTTGATILQDIESVTKGILFWRSLTHWIGGMGIIVLSLAIMPILGIGGMQLFVAEVPGPTKDKLHPRITDTAKRLWGIYVILTAVQTGLLMTGGLNVHDALCHAFGTMATGGFSTQNASIAGYSPYIQYTIIVFMFLAGTSFVLHYYALHLQFSKVYKNEEFRFYTLLIIIAAAVLSISLILFYDSTIEESFRAALFQTVSIVTTTGYITTDYLYWPPFAWLLIFLLMFTGGCAGSTGGGIKTVRQLLLFKNSALELKRLIHPKAVLPVRLNGKAVSEQVINNVLAFFLIYMLIFTFGSLFMSMLGLDFESSLGSVAACLGNIGPGIGLVGLVHNYSYVPDAGKWMLSFLMLLGRLELFTVLILFSMSFWKN
ncbi:MAG: potassium transporter TrkG [Bacteroidales bacterium]|nr:potassium transporter TrkG [Bacteroidales bacterium]MDZ4205039.1 potassium transporter TrkG [Bacteroidales bacterium]